MRCPACGTENPETVESCMKCGNPVAGMPQGAIEEKAKGGMSATKKTLVIIVAIVLITAVLSTTYLFLVGFGHVSIDTPSCSFENSTVTNGVRMTILEISGCVTWSDVTVRLYDGSASVEWSPVKDTFDDGSPVSVNLTSGGAVSIGSLSVYCWASDVSGDGIVNDSDYVEVFTGGGDEGFLESETYHLYLMFEPSGDPLSDLRFTG